MALCIRADDRTELLGLAESGFGYQLVAEGRVLILNATVALCLDDQWRLSPEDLRWLHDVYMPLHYNDAEEDLRGRLEAEDAATENLDYYDGALGIQVHGSYPSTARPNELFYRFSAFGPIGGLRPTAR